MLRDAVSIESVEVGAEAKDWREAVEVSARLLAAAGAVDAERYGPAMIRTVEELGPYVAIAPGVAIPHARPEDGVIGNGGVSVAVLKTPVEFGSEENDPVDVLFGFATPDKDAHVDTIRDIANMIRGQEKIEALRNARTREEALEILQSGD
jgi:PTS system ascorbate-specific IIA component